MRVFGKGFNLYGQLGAENPLIIEEFISIGCFEDFNLNFSYCVGLQDNSLLVIGSNAKKVSLNKVKLIASNNTKIICLIKENKLFKVDLNGLVQSLPVVLELNEITQLSCTQKSVVFCTENGLVCNFPNILETKFPSGIKEVKTGREHVIILDCLGNVWSFGRGSRGQLGLGELSDEIEPKLIEILAGIRIVSVGAGGWHSCALSQSGGLYTWGWNCNGQLGISKLAPSIQASPELVDIPQNSIVKMVACGGRHTIVLLEDNTLLGCGWNKYKQLDRIEQEEFFEFIEIQKPEVGRIVGLSCGPWNSAVFFE